MVTNTGELKEGACKKPPVAKREKPTIVSETAGALLPPPSAGEERLQRTLTV